MTSKKYKTILLASLLVAVILPFSVMGTAYTTGEDAGNNATKNQIQKAEKSDKEKALDNKALELFHENIDLKKQGSALKEKFQANVEPLTEEELKRLKEIDKRIKEIKIEVGKLQAAHEELVAISAEDKPMYDQARKLIRESGIPTTGFGTDHMRAALYIGFETQEIAERYIDKIEALIDVPFYIEIMGYDIPVAINCPTRTSDCDIP